MSSQQPPVPDRIVRYARILGLLFVVAGFAFIFFGWNGMARQACVDCQMPYLLSGGAAGVGLILFGSALLVIASNRSERIAADRRFEELIRATGRVGSAIAVTTGEATELVVAGRSTYHRPECRLVKDKDDLDRVTVQVAAGSGLSPCRVCAPPAPEAGDGPSGDGEGGAKPAEEAPAPAGASAGKGETAGSKERGGSQKSGGRRKKS